MAAGTRTITPMSRPLTGTIRRKRRKDGTTTFSLKVAYEGEDVTVPLGNERDGWTEERVERQLQYTIEQIERGEWVPPNADPKPEKKGSGRTTYAEAAAAFLNDQAVRLPEGREGKTYTNIEWLVEMTVGYIDRLAVERVNEGTLNKMVTDLLLDSERIREAIQAGTPEYRVVNGRQYKKKPISRATVNRFVATAGRVLDFAYAQQWRTTPAPDLKRIKIKVDPPKRAYLQVREGLALTDAAQAAEEKARGLQPEDVAAIRASTASAVRLAKDYGVSDVLIGKIRRGELWVAPRRRNDVPRVPIVKTLILAGPRIEHLCLLDVRHFDRERRRLDLPDHKTGDSARSVPLVPSLYMTLVDHVLDVKGEPFDPLFPTRNGTRQDPNNLRKMLEPLGKAIGVHVTPHMLRRTFASILAEIGVPPRRAMYLLGHKDPSFTMSVYQGVLDADESTWELLPELLGCTPEEALITLGGRGVSVPNRSQDVKTPLAGLEQTDQGGRNPAR